MGQGSGLERREELSLLGDLLAGDRSAAQRFFESYNGLIELSVRHVFRRAGRREAVEEVRDVVADVWLFLLDDDMRSLRRFEPEREIRLATWIGLLARHRTIDHLRTHHDRRMTFDDGGMLDAQASAQPLPIDEMESRELRQLAALALEHLKADDRRFLEAWYLEDRQPDDLADEFNIAVGTVYSRRFKIQEKLARLVHRLCRPRSPFRTLH